jgi:hypothetical protein
MSKKQKSQKQIVAEIKRDVFKEIADYWHIDLSDDELHVAIRGMRGFTSELGAYATNFKYSVDMVKEMIGDRNILVRRYIKAGVKNQPITIEEEEQVVHRFNEHVLKIIKYVNDRKDKSLRKKAQEKYDEGVELLKLWKVEITDFSHV